jgi:hypothetical protein
VTRIAALLIFVGFASLLWFPAEAVLFGGLGILLGAVLLGCSSGLLRLGSAAWRRTGYFARRRTDLLLALWLLIELGVYFATSPFPASRRLLGIVVVSTVLIGRMAALAARLPDRVSSVGPALILGVTLGLGYFAVDLRGADQQLEGAGRAASTIRAREPDARIWYVGHWGFQFYARREGMRAVVPDVSKIERGDWLVVPEGLDQQEILLDPVELETVSSFEFDRFPSLRTEPGYYAGGLPLVHRDGPHLKVDLYRARRSFTARTSWPTARIVDWALRSTGRTAAAAVPALVPHLLFDDLEGRRKSAQALAAIGALAEPATAALLGALGDPDATVRYWSIIALGRIGAAASRAIPRLEQLTEDSSKEVQQAAREALDAIAG